MSVTPTKSMITQLLNELIETVATNNVKTPKIKIYGKEWGAPPTDSELDCSDDDECRDEFEQNHNWWANSDDESDYYDDGDVAEYWNERQYDCR